MESAVSPAPALKWGRTAYQHPGRWWNTGNRCGHDPKSGEFERYQAPSTKRALPQVMQRLLEGVRAYYDSPHLLPTLGNLNGRANSDGTPRSNRSEARAAECLVLSAIIHHTEFATMRVGTPRPDGSFVARSCAELARVAGLLAPGSTPENPEPSQRFWRAFRRLKIAGAFTVHQQYEILPDGSKRARPAIKAVSMQFLVCLGKVGFDTFKRFRDWCSKGLKKARRAYREQFPASHDADQARRQLVTRQAAAEGVSAKLPPQRRGKRDLPDVDQDLEAQRRYSWEVNDYFASVMANNPGASPAEIRELVRLKYPPYEVWLASQ